MRVLEGWRYALKYIRKDGMLSQADVENEVNMMRKASEQSKFIVECTEFYDNLDS